MVSIKYFFQKQKNLTEPKLLIGWLCDVCLQNIWSPCMIQRLRNSAGMPPTTTTPRLSMMTKNMNIVGPSPRMHRFYKQSIEFVNAQVCCFWISSHLSVSVNHRDVTLCIQRGRPGGYGGSGLWWGVMDAEVWFSSGSVLFMESGQSAASSSSDGCNRNPALPDLHCRKHTVPHHEVDLPVHKGEPQH